MLKIIIERWQLVQQTACRVSITGPTMMLMMLMMMLMVMCPASVLMMMMVRMRVMANSGARAGNGAQWPTVHRRRHQIIVARARMLADRRGRLVATRQQRELLVGVAQRLQPLQNALVRHVAQVQKARH